MTISAFENLYGGRLAGGIVNAMCVIGVFGKELDDSHASLQPNHSATLISLGGVITVQGSLYYHRYPTDPLHVKVVVGFLWLAQMFYVVVSTCSFYHFLIKDFGVIFLGTEWFAPVHLMMSVISSAIVQFFFVFRLHLLSSSIWLPILIAGMTIVQFTFGLCTSNYPVNYIIRFVVTAARGHISSGSPRRFYQGVRGAPAHSRNRINVLPSPLINRTISQNVEVIPGSLRPFVTVWLSLEAASDLLIAASVCYFLRQNRTGIHLTDSVIRKLSIYALNTGAFTSILAIIGLLAFVFYGLHFATLLSTVPLGGAYITTLLAK
ncbi:uncharacterized protein EI90DRAFT_3124331 [Cantharellus anzutake]|uniref:uncharacterized protein n=1 Tax=Cantharellus anzutake TaxID=1750568 RepID=UPI0019039478|nr:uncharacterized protein EI90DRAFT_3124331 [Cantharellus anzutake]KAF8330304.1 hypothetical protein EI90DRAFT_3124331 [Cantharellus anzutake]